MDVWMIILVIVLTTRYSILLMDKKLNKELTEVQEKATEMIKRIVERIRLSGLL